MAEGAGADLPLACFVRGTERATGAPVAGNSKFTIDAAGSLLPPKGHYGRTVRDPSQQGAVNFVIT
jgi:hypothetical protein